MNERELSKLESTKVIMFSDLDNSVRRATHLADRLLEAASSATKAMLEANQERDQAVADLERERKAHGRTRQRHNAATRRVRALLQTPPVDASVVAREHEDLLTINRSLREQVETLVQIIGEKDTVIAQQRAQIDLEIEQRNKVAIDWARYKKLSDEQHEALQDLRKYVEEQGDGHDTKIVGSTIGMLRVFRTMQGLFIPDPDALAEANRRLDANLQWLRSLPLKG